MTHDLTADARSITTPRLLIATESCRLPWFVRKNRSKPLSRYIIVANLSVGRSTIPARSKMLIRSDREMICRRKRMGNKGDGPERILRPPGPYQSSNSFIRRTPLVRGWLGYGGSSCSKSPLIGGMARRTAHAAPTGRPRYMNNLWRSVQ